MCRLSQEGNAAATSQKDAVPQAAAALLDVVLVRHEDARAAPEAAGFLEGRRERESRAADPLDAASGRHVLLDRLLVGGAGSFDASAARVGPFGVLAEKDEVHVRGARLSKRDDGVVERAHGTYVREEVEAAAHAEQDLVRVPPVRDARVAEGAGEDGVEVAREHLEAPAGTVSPVFRK